MSERYCRAIGQVPDGATIMTTRNAQGRGIGVAVAAFKTVSLEPPLVLWRLPRSAPSHPDFAAASVFAVNVLAEDPQAGAAGDMADRAHLRGASGVPLIDGALAHIECRVAERVTGRAYEIILGEVVGFRRLDTALADLLARPSGAAAMQ